MTVTSKLELLSDGADIVDKVMDDFVTPGESVRETPLECEGPDIIELFAIEVENTGDVTDTLDTVDGELLGRETEVAVAVGDSVKDPRKVVGITELSDKDVGKVGAGTVELLEVKTEDTSDD